MTVGGPVGQGEVVTGASGLDGSIDLDGVTLEQFQRFYRFVREVILPFEPKSFVELAPFHLQLMWTACKKESASAAPRGSLKSTIVSRWHTLFLVTDEQRHRDEVGLPPVDVLMVSEGGDLPKEHLDWIKEHLQDNVVLKERYGYLPDESKLTWNDGEIELRNSARVIAKGINARLRGLHPTHIKCDDIEGENSVSSEDTLKSLKDKFWLVIWPMLTPSSSLSFIGTIVCRDSLLSDLLKSGEFYGKLWRALEEVGGGEDRQTCYESLWPQRWSVEWLLEQRRKMGLHRFNQEFQNAPLASGDAIILHDWVRRHSNVDLMRHAVRPRKRYMAVDPAVTEEKRGCDSAIVVVDEYPNGQLYETLAWRGKLPSPRLRDMIVSTYEHIRHDSTTGDIIPVVLGIEEVAMQRVFRQAIQELHPHIPIVPCKPYADKVTRLVDVSRYIELGTVSIESDGLSSELVEAPDGPMDRVDAFVYCLNMYQKEHPLIADSASTELDIRVELDDTSRALAIDRAIMGMPGYDVHSEQLRKFYESVSIEAEMADMDY